MPKIPLALEPMPDELMISYLYRLAQRNEMSFSMFINRFIYPNSGLERRNQQDIKYDANTAFSGFYEAESSHPDRARFYLDRSIYGAAAPFMTHGQQMLMVNEAFRTQNNLSGLIPKQNSTITELKYCPVCAEEDKKKGIRYYRRKHNLPGINVCPVHGCVLKIHHIKAENRLFEITSEDLDCPVTDAAWEKQYALFAAALLDAEIDTDITAVSNAVFRKLWDDHLAGNDYQPLRDLITHRNVSQMMNVDITHFMRISMISPVYVDKAACLALVCLLFNNIDELKAALKPDYDLMLRVLNEAAADYDIYKPFRMSLLSMRHKDSGERFVTTGYGFLSGWREPSADIGKSEADKAYEIFDNVTDGTYELMGSFTGMDKPLLIRHMTCGKILHPRARAFLVDGARCTCESQISFKEAADRVAGVGPYTLLEFTRTENACRIRHDTCGTVFIVDRYRNFLRHPHCPECDANQVYDEQSYKKVVEDLVGDEYTVIDVPDRAVSMIQIRHNVCGKTTEYRANRFLAGQRCPYCSHMYRDKDFRECVTSLSNGQYRIGKRIKARDSDYEIIHVKTGGTRVMDALYILQELRRPTPSKALPLAGKGRDYVPETVKSRLLFLLQSEYKADDLIFLEDVRLADVEKTIIKTRMQNLAKAGSIYNLMPGVYSFSNIMPDAERYIRERYLIRQGHVIGINASESLAYELGIFDEEPGTWYIMTNKESQTHGRKKTVMGIQIRIQGSPVLIMDSNADILKVLEMLKMRFKRGWDVYPALRKFVGDHNLSKDDFRPYLKYYSDHVGRDLETLYNFPISQSTVHSDEKDPSDARQNYREKKNTGRPRKGYRS